MNCVAFWFVSRIFRRLFGFFFALCLWPPKIFKLHIFRCFVRSFIAFATFRHFVQSIVWLWTVCRICCVYVLACVALLGVFTFHLATDDDYTFCVTANQNENKSLSSVTTERHKKQSNTHTFNSLYTLIKRSFLYEITNTNKRFFDCFVLFEAKKSSTRIANTKET